MSFKITRLLVPTSYCMRKLSHLIGLNCPENGLLDSDFPKLYVADNHYANSFSKHHASICDGDLVKLYLHITPTFL
ncbi:hypothetical protein T05_7760 [Trichinella murrelli]|uniref:Uncharacterized protein n=1 Tax=Trichinella murrelli TaxID=144512 RepID=A0A0V0SYJ6_9BILA|nr:hypothetical protein T05_7760 [Trichinella murrelli]